MNKKAVVLLSGGLDSSTTLHHAISKGYKCFALLFEYGQRHAKELKSAVAIAKRAKVPYQIIKIKLPWKGSALLDKKLKIRETKKPSDIGTDIPSTYVPGRNTIFLSFALSYAEAISADAIFIGANAIDYSGYPDCRPEYLMAFELLIRSGAKNKKIRVFAPLINKSKADIVRHAIKLKVPIHLTWSCYKGGKTHCGVCDSCVIRKKAFDEVGIKHYNSKR